MGEVTWSTTTRPVRSPNSATTAAHASSALAASGTWARRTVPPARRASRSAPAVTAP
ncbi:hypothetical protein [Kineococcus rubinsiae]|uniref:hypothetical protein n=1 Tax=Kineococcus rubinsiae TaxID=2609562 RepID=UPI001AD90E6B|nr:hypothetical protein [Kineococcus rubinsiae]